MAQNAYGIDLGTGDIKIYSAANDRLLIEKNLLAVRNRTEVIAFGDSAYDMSEKTPPNIQVKQPMNHGVIGQIGSMRALLKLFVDEANHGSGKAADYYVAVPTDVTPVEKKAFHDLIREAPVKTRKVYIVEKATADALGLDLEVENAAGVLLVNVGYETTEISIVSSGGMVVSRIVKIGGHTFDEDLITMIRREYDLYVGRKTAEQIKKSLTRMEEEQTAAVVFGRDVISGLPEERRVPYDKSMACMMPHFAQIVDAARIVLDRVPPELRRDIRERGIYLTGGGSRVHRMAEELAEGLGIAVNTVARPEETVVHGLERIIKEGKYQSLAREVEGNSK